MKQRHVRAMAARFGALAVGTVLAGCAGQTGGWWTADASPSATAPMPAPLDPARVGGAADVPAAVRTPLGQAMFLLVSARGVQIYECAARDASFGWTFRAPEATLTDALGVTVGRHYAGPTWEATDGSSVVGTLTASSPGNDTAAIPWLLLGVKSTAGTGTLTQTKSIQRLQTVGGVAPASGCGAVNAGATARVPYAATYAFFRAAP